MPVIVISAVSIEAGGIAYAVQRLAGVPIKFALMTVGEVWHKMVRRGDNLALRLASGPTLLIVGMAAVFTLMIASINAGVYMAYAIERHFINSDKLLTIIDAVQAYQLFFAVSLSVSLFDRVLVIRK